MMDKPIAKSLPITIIALIIMNIIPTVLAADTLRSRVIIFFILLILSIFLIKRYNLLLKIVLLKDYILINDSVHMYNEFQIEEVLLFLKFALILFKSKTDRYMSIFIIYDININLESFLIGKTKKMSNHCAA